MKRIEEIRARLNAATPGLWENERRSSMPSAVDLVCIPREDAILIVNAPSDLADLVLCLELAIDALRAARGYSYTHGKHADGVLERIEEILK